MASRGFRILGCRRHFTRLDELLEPPQILTDLRLGVAAEELRHRRTDLASRRAVLQMDRDARPGAPDRAVEVHRAGADDVCAFE
jgi:hypothetical protein